MKVIAVIPAFHEAPRLPSVLTALQPHVDQIVVVDDGSKDETAAVAAQHGQTVVLRHVLNRGQGAALRTGTEAALRLGADVIVHLDADGQQDPLQIRTLTEPIQQQRADVVFGSRFLGQQAINMPFSKRLLLQVGGVFLNRLILGIPAQMSDPQSGFRALSRQAAQNLAFRQDGFAHASEILRLVTHAPLRWLEVPITVRYSPETSTKAVQPKAFHIAWQLFLGVFHR